MPNECWNSLTVTGSEEDIKRFQEVEFKHDGKPIPEWALKIRHIGVEGLIFQLWSRWSPDFDWLNGLLEKYPSIWVKNVWNEEGGMEGVWIGSKRSGQVEVQQMAWEGMCIEEAAHRLREPDPVVKMYYILLDEKGEQVMGRFTQLETLMYMQDTYKNAAKWAIKIDEIGYTRVEEFPDLDDPKVRKAFALEPKEPKGSSSGLLH